MDALVQVSKLVFEAFGVKSLLVPPDEEVEAEGTTNQNGEDAQALDFLRFFDVRTSVHLHHDRDTGSNTQLHEGYLLGSNQAVENKLVFGLLQLLFDFFTHRSYTKDG